MEQAAQGVFEECGLSNKETAQVVKSAMPAVFERPLLPGWVYPCTTGDIFDTLIKVPGQDLDGLRVVGLVPATRKHCSTNARYLPGTRPMIQICSYSADLTYRQPPHTRRHQIEHGLLMELEYGMKVEQIGIRWACRWEIADLRRFILEYVLVHEIGHHVHSRDYFRMNGRYPEPSATNEQIAEAYACRWGRLREKGGR